MPSAEVGGDAGHDQHLGYQREPDRRYLAFRQAKPDALCDPRQRFVCIDSRPWKRAIQAQNVRAGRRRCTIYHPRYFWPVSRGAHNWRAPETACDIATGSPATTNRLGESQASRARDAIYQYLTAVFDLVAWWVADNRAIERGRKALGLGTGRLANPVGDHCALLQLEIGAPGG